MHKYSICITSVPHARMAGVELYGSEFEETNRRKHYSMLSDLYKRTWTATCSDGVGLREVVSLLLRLLVQLFSGQCRLAPPTSSYPHLQEYCRDRFGRKATGEGGEAEGGVGEEAVDYLSLAHPQMQALSLVYADSQLLFQFLQILNLPAMQSSPHSNINSSSNSSNSRQGEIELYEEFVLFLYKNCQDCSRFFQPLRRVLDASPVHSHRLSNLLVSLVTAHASAGGSDKSDADLQQSRKEMAEFIREGGGGEVVLRRLVESSSGELHFSQTGGGGVDSYAGFPASSISKLGQKDVPYKALHEATELVDFLPHCSLFRTTSATSGGSSRHSGGGSGVVRVTPNNPRSLSLFQHTFSPSSSSSSSFSATVEEKWVQLHAIFPHPVLLRNVIISAVPLDGGGSSTSCGGPSKLLVECSAHGGPDSCVPVTPVFSTDSLKVINVAFRCPLLTQRAVVHFRRPLLSSTLVVSRVELLATPFAADACAVTPGQSLAPTPLQVQEHRR